MSEIRLYRGVWCLYSREGGKGVRRSLGTKDRSVALARAATARQIERLRPERATVAHCWTEYRRHLGVRPAAVTMGFEAKAILPHFGHLPVGAITPEVVRSYIVGRQGRGIKPGTINTELTRLASCLNWARKSNVIEAAPHIARLPAAPPRLKFLTFDEAKRLIAACEMAHARLFVLLALTTAARMSAILQLRWTDIDFERGMIHFGGALDGQRRKRRGSVPMNKTARNALTEAQGRASTPFVVEWGGKPVANAKKAVMGAAARAGLSDVSPHVLRHTAAVRLAETGVPMSAISQYLGHSDTRVTERVYARFSPSYLRAQAAALDFE